MLSGVYFTVKVVINNNKEMHLCVLHKASKKFLPVQARGLCIIGEPEEQLHLSYTVFVTNHLLMCLSSCSGWEQQILLQFLSAEKLL